MDNARISRDEDINDRKDAFASTIRDGEEEQPQQRQQEGHDFLRTTPLAQAAPSGPDDAQEEPGASEGEGGAPTGGGENEPQQEVPLCSPHGSWSKEWKAASRLLPLHLLRLPILDWLPKYDAKSWLLCELNSGVLLAVYLIPEGLAYGMMLGIAPVHGLYGVIFFSIIYAFFGTSNETCPANTSLVTMMMADAVTTAIPLTATKTERMLAALKLTFLVGLVQFGLGTFKLGAIARFVSFPVMIAFNTAGILITALALLKYLVGLRVPRTEFPFQTIVYILQHLGESNLWEVLVGMSTFVVMSVILLLKKRPPIDTPLDRTLRKLAFMAPLSVVVMGTVATYLIETHQPGADIRKVGALPKGFVTFDAYAISLKDVSDFSMPAVTIAIVSFLISYGVERRYTSLFKYEVDVNQELCAFGLCNTIGSCFGSFTCTTGFVRSQLNVDAGGKTHITTLIQAGVTIIALSFLAPYFYYIPIPGLAGISTAGVLTALNYQPYYDAYRGAALTKDFAVLVASTIITLAVGIDKGIYCGIFLSIASLLLRSSYPDLTPLGRTPGSKQWRAMSLYPNAQTPPSLRVVRVDESLTFINSDHVKEQLLKQAALFEEEPDSHDDAKLEGKKKTVPSPKTRPAVGPRYLLVDASAASFVDLTAMRILHELCDDLRARGIRLLVARATQATRDFLRTDPHLFRKVGGEMIVLSVEDMATLVERDEMSVTRTLAPSFLDRNKQTSMLMTMELPPVPAFKAPAALPPLP